MEIAAIASGFLTGVIVGLTGVGGGALMTPILILLLGVAPHTAVGTDLLFATITKVVAVRVHGSHGTVDWQVVRRLAYGSLPAVVVVLVILSFTGQQRGAVTLLLPSIGIALVVTAVALFFKSPLHALGWKLRIGRPDRFKAVQPALTVLAGVTLGALVTLTSIGAGALGTVMLVYLYPLRLTPSRLVGTDLAHAIPVALVAGVGHLALGNVDFGLLGWLLAGSLPGAWIGAHFSTRAPERFLRNAIALILLVIGLRILT
jgi:uncharacterized membrane protein YfcA